MPSPNKSHHRNGQIEAHRRGRLGEKSSSFHGHTGTPPTAMSAAQIRRPKTLPDLLSYRNHAGAAPECPPRQPPKLLLKVTMLGSLGPVQVLMRPESTVGDLVAAAVQQYVKEGRRPILPTKVPSGFDLHYSQFSLESLDWKEKLIEIGSRNFFLCPRKATTTTTTTVEGGASRDGSVTTPFASCSKEADRVTETEGGGGFAWFKLMHFLL